MRFRLWLEAETDMQALADQIKALYNSRVEITIDGAFDQLAAGLPPEKERELTGLVRGMIARKEIVLRPTRFVGGQHVSYAPEPPKPRTMPEPQKEAMLEMMERAGRAFDKWLDNLYPDVQAGEDFHEDEISMLDDFAEFLREAHNIEVREDGIVEFYDLSGGARRLIGELPVVVYHYTSDALDQIILSQGIKSSSEPGVKKVNPYLNSSAGVYVTTETNGPTVEQYIAHAQRQYGGNPRCWHIQTYLSDLASDPDDQDLGVGRHQFILPYVGPSQLLNRD